MVGHWHSLKWLSCRPNGLRPSRPQGLYGCNSGVVPGKTIWRGHQGVAITDRAIDNNSRCYLTVIKKHLLSALCFYIAQFQVKSSPVAAVGTVVKESQLKPFFGQSMPSWVPPNPYPPTQEKKKKRKKNIIARPLLTILIVKIHRRYKQRGVELD